MQPFVHLVIAPVIHAGRRKHRKQPYHVAITLFDDILRLARNYGLSLFSYNRRACGAKWNRLRPQIVRRIIIYKVLQT